MFKASWWKERGYSEEYARQIAKGVRALAREINLREEDIEGLIPSQGVFRRAFVEFD